MGPKFVFGTICGGEINCYAYNSQDFSESPQLKNLSILAILGNDTFSSWDLIFCRNLTNVEIEDLERLLSLLSHVHLTPFIPDAKAWVPSFSGGFLVKSFLLVLSNFSDSTPFYLAHFFYGNQEPPLRL